MKEDYIKKITEDAEKRGHEVRIRDVAYALLRYKFDAEMAYVVVFGVPQNENDVETYEKSESTKYLIRTVAKDIRPEEKAALDIEKILAENESSKGEELNSISSKENRAGIEKQIEEILELKSRCPEEDIKTMALLQKTEADLRTKLNDKFGAAEKNEQDTIIVPFTFDYICPHTRHECYQMTKERAMKAWHLIPDPKYKE